MLKRLTGLMLLLALTSLATAQEPPKVDLVWKFVKDKAFYQEMTTKTTQGITISGQDVSQVQEHTFYFKWVPVRQEGDKWVIEQTIEAVKMRIDIAGNPISYDSTAATSTGNTALAEFFKALIGSKFTLTLNKDLKVEKVEGREEFVKKLSTANAAMETLLKKVLSEEAIKQMVDPTFGLNKAGVKDGDKWEVPVKLNLGPIGSYDTKYTYTYKGKDKTRTDFDLVEAQVAVTYATPGGSEEGGLPFKIVSADLKSKDSPVGKILYNPKTGMVESSELTVKLAGTLNIEIGGTKSTITLNQDQTTNVKTADKSFLPEKK